MPPRLPSLVNPQIGFAHRGARAVAPENSLEAFRKALEMGAGALESDAWLTADGVVVLVHDGVVRKGVRRLKISRTARADLPAHIPSLSDLYESCGSDFELSLDLKDPAAVAGVVEAARSATPEAESRLWLCHQDVDEVASWADLTSEAKLVHSVRNLPNSHDERHAAALRSKGIHAMCMHHSSWTGGRIALYHRFELMALGWDAQFERTLVAVLDAGIDAVYSDHVDLMTATIARFS